MSAILSARANGTQFTNIGQLFGEIAAISGTDSSQDELEEEAIARVVQLLTVRQNYFTVIVCAQAIKDVGGVPYVSVYNPDTGARTMGAAEFGELDVRLDSDGNVIGYADRILAERKAIAVVYRDAFSGATRIESLEPIDN